MTNDADQLERRRRRERERARRRRQDPAYRERQKGYAQAHYTRNRERVKADVARWKTEHPDRVRMTNRLRGKNATPEEYRALIEAHDGRCDICGTTEPGGRHGTFALDHDHDTGRLRGLLCNNCNRGIGLMKDDPARLLAAANYLKRAD